MESQRIAEELRTQLRERPYWTTAAIFGVGWLLGRSLPLRAVLGMARVGVPAAMLAAFEDVVVRRAPARADDSNPDSN